VIQPLRGDAGGGRPQGQACRWPPTGSSGGRPGRLYVVRPSAQSPRTSSRRPTSGRSARAAPDVGGAASWSGLR